MEDKRIFEDTAQMLYKLFFEKLSDGGKSDFSGMFFEFYKTAKEYALSQKSDTPQAKVLKYELSKLVSDLKNHEGNSVCGYKKSSMENTVNELIFSTCLNETKAEKCGTIENEKLCRLFHSIKSVINFNAVCPTTDFYGFWCFLRLGFALRELHKTAKDNIIDEDLKVKADGALIFSLKNKASDEIELLYNYSGNGTFKTDLKSIYLIVKNQGKPPVFFVLRTSYEIPEGEDIKNLSSVLNTVSNGMKIFSGAFFLTSKNADSAGKVITFSPEKTAEMSKLFINLCDYNFAVFMPCVTEAQAHIMAEYRILCRNVLLVTVKSKEQLEINLKNNFYHMPANFNAQCEYIAVYQSETLFGKAAAGIYHFGKIEKASLVRRHEIKEIPRDSNELYYRFTVNWETLENRIKPEGSVKAFAVTSLYLLQNSKTVGELFIRNYDEYASFKFFEKYAKRVRIIGDCECIYAITADKLRLEFTNYGVILYNEGKEIFSLDRIFYKRNIKSVMKKIKAEIFGK